MNSVSGFRISDSVPFPSPALLGELTPQRSTSAGTHGGTTHTAGFGANRTPGSTTHYGPGLSLALGRDGRSGRTAQGTTNDLARFPADTFPYCRSCCTSSRTADRCLGVAVTSLHVRQQQATAQANDNQDVILHRKIPLVIEIFKGSLEDPSSMYRMAIFPILPLNL